MKASKEQTENRQIGVKLSLIAKNESKEYKKKDSLTDKFKNVLNYEKLEIKEADFLNKSPNEQKDILKKYCDKNGYKSTRTKKTDTDNETLTEKKDKLSQLKSIYSRVKDVDLMKAITYLSDKLCSLKNNKEYEPNIKTTDIDTLISSLTGYKDEVTVKNKVTLEKDTIQFFMDKGMTEERAKEMTGKAIH